MDSKNKKIAGLICIALAFISAFTGIIVLISGFAVNSVFASDTDKSLTGKTKGEVTEVTYFDTYVKADVSYTVDNVNYSISPCFSPEKVVVGKTVNVRYKLSSPETADVSKTGFVYSVSKLLSVMGWIIICIGIVFAVAAVCLFVSGNAHRRKDSKAQ